MKLIIPTYNRSAKLHRTLEYYSNVRERINCEIYVLDGSTSDHASWNEKNAGHADRISYINFSSDIPLLERLLKFLESCPDDELIIVGNDEDVFLPAYFSEAQNFMEANNDYSSYIGRYVTLCKPIFGFKRLSHFRDYITDCDISMTDPMRRLSLLMTMNMIGCSPVFYSIRRNNQLITSLKCQLQVHFASTGELVDQAMLSLSGKVKFVDKAMLLRDETNLGYQASSIRNDPDVYINEKDLEKFLNAVSSADQSEGLLERLELIADWFRPIEGETSKKPSLAITRHRNAYSSYRSLSQKSFFPESFIRNISRCGTVLSQIVSWFSIKRQLLMTEEKSSMDIFLRTVKTHDKYEQ